MSRGDWLNAGKPKAHTPTIDTFEDGVYHIYDYQCFCRNLQENVGARLDAYLVAYAQDTAK